MKKTLLILGLMGCSAFAQTDTPFGPTQKLLTNKSFITAPGGGAIYYYDRGVKYWIDDPHWVGFKSNPTIVTIDPTVVAAIPQGANITVKQLIPADCK